MHFKNVEIFCDVVTRLSFSKAAEAHNVSQSSASQAVGALEKRLGTKLIDRSKRPFELTSAGQVYFNGCRKVLESLRKLEDEARQVQDKVVGRVRMAAIYSVGLLQMGAYVRRYEELYPEVRLQVEYLHPDEVYSRLLNDEADMGIVSFPKEGGEIGSIPWQEQEMVLVVPPNHRLAGKQSIHIAELNGEDFVAFTSELRIRRKLDRWLRDVKVSVTVVHEFDNTENIKRAVEIGSGVTILPEPTLKREIDAGLLCSVKLEDVNWYRPLGIVHKRHKTLSTAAEKLVELLHEDPETFSENHLNANSTKTGSNGEKSTRHKSRRMTTGTR
jgi:DNA-binding transcriptional LysR family regulator